MKTPDAQIKKSYVPSLNKVNRQILGQHCEVPKSLCTGGFPATLLSIVMEGSPPP